MSVTVGILVFDGVDELDFVGPLEVFSYAADWGKAGTVVTVGKQRTACRGVNGLSFSPGHVLADCPDLDVVVIPGGHGAHLIASDEEVLRWVRKAASSARWICSVCTGSFVLQAAGLAEGKRITTHSGMIDQLRAGKTGTVVEGERYVVDGTLVTSAGVSAGLDMSLWVVGQIYGEAHARTVRANLEYNPAPPY